MNGDRFFMDTSFVIARFNKNDSYHDATTNLLPRVRAAKELWFHDVNCDRGS